jgi:hypothetical protein
VAAAIIGVHVVPLEPNVRAPQITRTRYACVNAVVGRGSRVGVGWVGCNLWPSGRVGRRDLRHGTHTNHLRTGCYHGAIYDCVM